MQLVVNFIVANWLNIVALIWFLVCFNGYMIYSKRQSYSTACLASVMHLYRMEWMRRVCDRENRIADTAAVANLEKSVSFFASTTMLVLAGLVTVLGSTEEASQVIADLPFSVPATQQEWEIKLMVVITLFVYAFFKFTWSLRQYGFVSVMIGGAPNANENATDTEKEIFANRAAKMTSMAANNFNTGLRSYYFSLAMLAWFVNPYLFMAVSAGVVIVLYRREFKSSTLRSLMMSRSANFSRND